MRRRLVALAALVAGALATPTVHAAVAPPDHPADANVLWWHEGVDAAGDAGSYSSLRLDSHGRPVIAYYDVEGHDLRLAREAGAGWSAVRVDTAGDVGTYTSLALDASDRAHISYLDVTHGDLRYASETAAGFAIETIDTDGTVGLYSSLALDAAGWPHIAYHDVTRGDLKLAVRSAGGWTVTTVDSFGTVGEYVSLALDAAGYAHFSYYDGTNGDLRYAVQRANGTFSIYPIDDLGNTGLFTSLALDANGRGRIGYTDFSSYSMAPGRPGVSPAHGYHVKYAEERDYGWWVETADASGFWSQWVNIALGADGQPHLAYYDYQSGRLKYAVRYPEGGWDLRDVGEATGVGDYPSMVLDANGQPRLSYYDAADGALRYSSGAVEIREPHEGTTWPPKGTATLRWTGAGVVDVWMSMDGGSGWTRIAESLGDTALAIDVPDARTTNAVVKIERGAPYYSQSVSAPFAIAPARATAFEAAPSLVRPGGWTTLRFATTAEDGDVDLAIYSARGERIATLAHGAYPPGEHAVVFDPEAGGSRVSSGLYFARLETRLQQAVARVLLFGPPRFGFARVGGP